MTFHDIQRRLETLLREAGCVRYTARHALADAAAFWREVRQSNIAHGKQGEEPIFNFIVAEGVGIFSFYGTNAEFYVVRGDESACRNDSKPLQATEAEWVFRNRFKSLAMVDVAAARAILASEFNRKVPDLTIEAPLIRAWLLSSSDEALKSNQSNVLSYAGASLNRSYVSGLLLAQFPAALGIGWVGLTLLGAMPAGIYGEIFIVAFLASIVGVVISLLITRAFKSRSGLREVSILLLAVHLLYLAAALGFVCWIVVNMVKHPYHGHSGGGF